MSSAVVELSSLYKFSGSGLPVLLVSDTATVDATRTHSLDYEICTWVGDAFKVDYAPLQGHHVIIWPTNSKAEIDHARKLGAHLASLGINGRVMIPEGQPPAWTLADCRKEKIDFETFAGRNQGRYLRPFTLTPARALKDEPKPQGSQWVLLKELGFQDGKIPPANEDTVDNVLTHAKLPFWYDDFLQRAMTRWLSDAPRAVTDGDVAMLTVHFQRTYGIAKMSTTKVRSGLDHYLQRNRRNSAQEWLRGLTWDGVERLPTVLSKGWGVPQDAYHEAVGRCWFMGMTNRVLEPGCHYDNFPLFEGGEGIGKSTALRVVGGDWFTECHESVLTKDFLQIMPGQMLLEIGELNSFRKADIGRINGIISNRVDTYRESYGRIATSRPRQCSFAGTTNRNDWNMSDTGFRRAWRILVEKVDLYYLRENREQLFAEAVARLDNQEVYHDVPQDLAKRLQDDARIEDSWTGPVLDYAMSRRTTNAEDVMTNALQIPAERQNNYAKVRIHAILKMAGFVSMSVWENGRTVRAWKRSALLSGEMDF